MSSYFTCTKPKSCKSCSWRMQKRRRQPWITPRRKIPLLPHHRSKWSRHDWNLRAQTFLKARNLSPMACPVLRPLTKPYHKWSCLKSFQSKPAPPVLLHTSLPSLTRKTCPRSQIGRQIWTLPPNSLQVNLTIKVLLFSKTSSIILASLSVRQQAHCSVTMTEI